ncbi:MAG: hypothetical protein A2Z15_07725 [Chloroflexi bacterium RBG_16_50_11]|nr:MAG: hypothetical protein A2Z15_07725 [Chloroflexi bacterium RBG_16_50_11]
MRIHQLNDLEQAEIQYQEQYQKNEEARIEQLKVDLQINQQDWISSNVTNYALYLEVFVGGQEYYSEGKRVALLRIQVKDNNISDLKAFSDGTFIVMNPEENIYFKSISDLYAIIQDTLDGNENQDVSTILKASSSNYVSYQSLAPPLLDNPVPIKVHAEFSSSFGYPEIIELYFGPGRYEKHYIISFRISSFRVIFD